MNPPATVTCPACLCRSLRSQRVIGFGAYTSSRAAGLSADLGISDIQQGIWRHSVSSLWFRCPFWNYNKLVFFFLYHFLRGFLKFLYFLSHQLSAANRTEQKYSPPCQKVLGYINVLILWLLHFHMQQTNREPEKAGAGWPLITKLSLDMQLLCKSRRTRHRSEPAPPSPTCTSKSQRLEWHWFCAETQLVFGLTYWRSFLRAKSQAQPPSSAGGLGTCALIPVSHNTQLSGPTIQDYSRALVLFPHRLHKLYLPNEQLYLCQYGKITDSFKQGDGTAREQQPDVQKPATFQQHVMQHHTSPSELNTHPHLVSAEFYTQKTHI